ncbi:hypothetical protein CR513_50307, partial [Mucuna pruriens]
MRLHQMDAKCVFLNSIINEEVYVKQPPEFEGDTFPNHVFKLKKTLYGLKQARAWYEKLSSFLMENGFQKGKIKQANDDIYMHQIKYVKELLKKFKFNDCNSMSTPMHPISILTLNDYDKKQFDKYKLKDYCDADYVRDNKNKRHHCYSQLLYIKHQLQDCNIYESNILLLCDNNATINLLENPILHSRVKHIENKHLFIRYYIQKGIFYIKKFISTNEQLTDIFTQPFFEDKLHIKDLLGMKFIKGMRFKVYGGQEEQRKDIEHQ